MRQFVISKSFTRRDEISLNKYLQEVAQQDMVSKEEEADLAQRIRNGDKKAFDKLAKANLRFVISVAKQYQNQGLSLPDLINEGNLGLLTAAEKFDETRGFKFISFAVWWIRQGILRALAEKSRLVRLPYSQLRILNSMSKMRNDFEFENERMPSSFELSEMLEMPDHKLLASIQASGKPISVDAPVVEDEEFCLIDVLENPNSPMSDSRLINESLSQDVESVLSFLSKREKIILKLYYGIGVYPMTTYEIADRLKLTPERVRQLKDKAIRSLKKYARTEILKQYLG